MRLPVLFLRSSAEPLKKAGALFLALASIMLFFLAFELRQ